MLVVFNIAMSPVPRFFDTDGDCAQVLDTAINGEWSTTKCTDSRNAFLCERAEGKMK